MFLDAFPTVNSFLARYFVNRGQTGERWELNTHALGPVLPLTQSLVHLPDQSSATYGWKDNTENIPPIHTHIHDIELTQVQRAACRTQKWGHCSQPTSAESQNDRLSLRSRKAITMANAYPQNKPEFIRDLVRTWPEESTIMLGHL